MKKLVGIVPSTKLSISRYFSNANFDGSRNGANSIFMCKYWFFENVKSKGREELWGWQNFKALRVSSRLETYRLTSFFGQDDFFLWITFWSVSPAVTNQDTLEAIKSSKLSSSPRSYGWHLSFLMKCSPDSCPCFLSLGALLHGARQVSILNEVSLNWPSLQNKSFSASWDPFFWLPMLPTSLTRTWSTKS